MSVMEISVTELRKFRFVNTLFCKAQHGPRKRSAEQISAEDALTKEGEVRPRCERLIDEQGEDVGYAQRVDEFVYPHAEEILKDGIARAREELEQVCFKIEGGALVLPEVNFDRWDEVCEAIAQIQEETNGALESLHVDEDDSGSALVNDLLRSKKKPKPMLMEWIPLLHPCVTISDDNGKETIAALCRSALGQVRELVEAVQNKDTVKMGRLCAELRNVEHLFQDETAKKSVTDTVAMAKKAKAHIEEETHARRMAARTDVPAKKAEFTNRAAVALRDRILAMPAIEAVEIRGPSSAAVTLTKESLKQAKEAAQALRQEEAKAQAKPKRGKKK